MTDTRYASGVFLRRCWLAELRAPSSWERPITGGDPTWLWSVGRRMLWVAAPLYHSGYDVRGRTGAEAFVNEYMGIEAALACVRVLDL